ncbi:hypothetical protein IWQ61_009150 [Dispira simplex]|nr:hypothetical protein IWQ61_009150 [Dispira simplex]
MAKPFFKILWPWLALIKLSLSLPTHYPYRLLPNDDLAPDNGREPVTLPDGAVPLWGQPAITPGLVNYGLREPPITHALHRASPPSNDEVSSTHGHITDDGWDNGSEDDTDEDTDDGWDNGSDNGSDEDTDTDYGTDDDVLSEAESEEQDVPGLTDGESEIDSDSEGDRLFEFPGASTLMGYFPPGAGAPQ